MERKIGIFGSMIVVIMLFTGGFILLMGSEEADGYIEELITPFGYSQGFPAVDGMYLVYEDHTPAGERIMLRNLRSGFESHIVNFDSFAPDISGDRIVFLSDHDGNWDVYEYMISTTNYQKITNNAMVEFSPRVDGENIVWYEDQPGHDLSIIHYSPGTGINKISSYLGMDIYPNIHGNLVVWQNDEPGYHIVRSYDLVTRQEKNIVDKQDLDVFRPDIYGDRVVYVSQSGPNELVWLYNITTKTDLYVSNFNYRSDWPRIDRDHVVFLTAYDSRWDVAMYDILTGMEHRLTFDGAVEHFPVVWGEHVAYTKDRGGLQVYYMLMDYDDDGIPDQKDMFPYNPTEIFDTDGDGLGDNIDPDADGDGYLDEMDAFPFDDMEFADFDGDGWGDNFDHDDDNDGIPDLEDVFPFSDINPIIDILHILMIRIDTMEANLTERIDDLESTIEGLLDENEAGIMEGIDVALADLNDTLSRINLSGELEAMQINLSDLIAQEPDWYEAPESFFDIFTQLVVDLGNDLNSKLENLSQGMNYTREEINDLNDKIEALEEIEGIVSELEEVGRNVETQSENLETSDSNLRTYFIVLIIVLAVYTLIMILFFVNVSRKKRIEEDDEF